jgi:cyclic pyranopterin phosphate synthase
MFDKFNRRINYLRISVTDRCNLRCTYCMPPEGVELLSHKEILSYDEIIEIVRYAVSQGIDKIRITGGEPLVRKGIISLIEQIAKIDGVKDFGMTTNAVLLSKYAEDLKKAGLHRLNISLDTLDPQKYSELTRIGNLNDVLAGIEAAKLSGFFKIKINCVIKISKEEPDAVQVAEFCKNNNLEVRFIHEMDLEKGQFWQVDGGEGGKCSSCNRLRITSIGKLKPCLFSGIEYDLRKLGIEKAFELALNSKPIKGTINETDRFNNLGG